MLLIIIMHGKLLLKYSESCIELLEIGSGLQLLVYHYHFYMEQKCNAFQIMYTI